VRCVCRNRRHDGTGDRYDPNRASFESP
jgi:hypothetical protein